MDKGHGYETRLKKLFIGGLNRNTSDETVKEYFAKYGVLEDSVVIRDSNKASRGFGYVTFSDYRCTFQVLTEKKEKGGHTIDGKTIDVKRAIPRDDSNPTSHTKTKKIFLGGLKKDADDSDVRQEIEKVLEGNGTVVKIDLIKDKETGDMRGFGFIEFEDEDTVDTLCCIKNLNIKGKMVEVKKAESRNKDGGGGGGRGGGFGARGGGGRGGGYGTSRGGGYSHGGGGGYDASAYGAGGMYGAAAGGAGYGAAAYGGGYGAAAYSDGYGGMGGIAGMYGQTATNFGPQRAAYGGYGGNLNGAGARNFGGGNTNRGAMGRYNPY